MGLDHAVQTGENDSRQIDEAGGRGWGPLTERGRQQEAGTVFEGSMGLLQGAGGDGDRRSELWAQQRYGHGSVMRAGFRE